MAYSGSIDNPNNNPEEDSQTFWDPLFGRAFNSMKAKSYNPSLSTECVTDPQKKAERAQQKKPNRLFTFIINLDAWRKHCAALKGALEH